eukprot:m.7978 g.7978  ORF g.7978 m.7978 type:complete len:435 (-) comp2240_c0_seq1:65-1369(-)
MNPMHYESEASYLEQQAMYHAAAGGFAHGIYPGHDDVGQMQQHGDMSGGQDVGMEEGRPTNLIVNYIPSSMSSEDFRRLFESLGPLKSCKIMKDKATGIGLGYGFVEYMSAEDAQQAISQLNGHRIENKSLKVSIARPSSAAITNANLYIRGLPVSMSPDELRAMFSQFGNIVTVRVLPPSGKLQGPQRGVGFVRFDKRVEAERAVQAMDGTIPPGWPSPLHIKFADHRPRGVDGKAMPPHVNMGPVMSAPMPMGSRAIPGYLPYGVNPYMPEPEQVAPKAADPAAAAAAAVAAAYGVFPMSQVYPYMTASPSYHPALSWQVMIRPEAALPPEGTCLFVFNLPIGFDENALFQLFMRCGTVVKAKITRPASPTNKGFGFVTMMTQMEAFAAIQQLNNATVGGHVLQVSLKGNRRHSSSSFGRSASDPPESPLLP